MQTYEYKDILLMANIPLQGGVKNYLGSQRTVSNVPVKWKSGPDKPETELAYITEAEKDLLLKEDIHGSLSKGPNMGPGGLMSLDSWGDTSGGQSGADVSAGESRGHSGGDKDPRTTYSYTAHTKPTVATTANMEDAYTPPTTYQNVHDTGAISRTPGNTVNEDVYQDRIMRMRSGVEPGYRPQDERPYGFQDIEEAYRQGAATKDEYDLYIDAEPVLTLDRGLDEPTFNEGKGGDGITTVPVETDITPIVETAEETGLTEAELQENIDKYRAMYGENVPVDIQEFAAPVENPLVDQRMYRPYEENIQLMTAADGGRAGYKYGEFVSPHTEDDDEETMRAQALASLPQYQLFSQRRKAALGGRMNYNQGGIVALRQPAAFGGIMGPDGRRGYFLGSIGKIFKKVTKPIKKIIKSPIGKAALMYAGLSGLGSIGAGKTGWERFAPEMFKKGLSKINPMNLFSSQEEKFAKVLKEYGLNKETYKALDIKDKIALQELVKKSSMSGMDIAAAVGIPAVMAGTAAYTTGTEQDDTADMNKYLAEQDKLVDPFRVKYGKTVPTDFQTLPYTFAAQGGRIGYRGGKGVTSLQAGAPDIKYEGNMRMASYGYDDAMGESWEEYKRLQKKGVIPIDMEFEEFLDLQQGGGFLEGRAPGRAPDRAMAQEGGLMDLGGMEKDYRQEGGFVPIGGQEKADDVPARLSKNEFVFTADAVRAAGGGDIDEGAAVMERLMENLEAGGKVSEESQGLEGARNMFANAQQLEKRII